MTFLSNNELKDLLVDWINTNVPDPLSADIRGTGKFAHSELRKGSEKLPKIMVMSASHLPTLFYFGSSRPYDSEIIFNVWMYVKIGKENIYTTEGGKGLKNNELMEHWLTGELIKAIRNTETLPNELSSPRWGEFSGVQLDDERPGVLKGFIPISFKRRTV